MVWTDVSFRCLPELTFSGNAGCLHNSLIAEKLINGHVATQILAIRRLVDQTKGVISLRRIITELRSNFSLFTRENYICFDGLPYDYESVQLAEMRDRAGTGAFWGATSGPGAWSASQMAHEQFDRLSGIAATSRSRNDRLPARLLSEIVTWLDSSPADQLAGWSHAFLAHAGNPVRREQLVGFKVTNDKITETIKVLSRVIEAISAFILNASGRLHGLMPTPQFDQLENLDQPAMLATDAAQILHKWDELSQ
jgi:hypothetical protein